MIGRNCQEVCEEEGHPGHAAPAAPQPAYQHQQTTTPEDDAWLVGRTQTRQIPSWADSVCCALPLGHERAHLAGYRNERPALRSTPAAPQPDPVLEAVERMREPLLAIGKVLADYNDARREAWATAHQPDPLSDLWAFRRASEPECGPICATTGHHHDVETCDGCRRLADMMHAAGMALRSEDAAPQPNEHVYSCCPHEDAAPQPDNACPHGHFGGYLCPECGDATAHPSPPDAPTNDSPGEDGPAQPGAAATPGIHAVLAPFLVSPDHILDGLTCWCRPYRDAEDPEVIIHQQEARA